MHAPNAFLFNFCKNMATFDKTFDLWQLHEIDFLYCAELVNKRENINSLTKISTLHKRLPVTGLENSEGFCITHRQIT